MSGVAPYPAYAHHDGFVFVLSRKCGCNAVKHALWSQMGGEGEPLMDYVTAQQIRIADWPVIAIVRDPVARVVSCWRDKIHHRWMPSLEIHGMFPGMDFGPFLDIVLATPDAEANRHFRSFSDELIDGQAPDEVLLTEQLAQGWERLEHRFGWPALGIERRNATNGTPPLELSDGQRVAIRQRYPSDHALYEKARRENDG